MLRDGPENRRTSLQALGTEKPMNEQPCKLYLRLSTPELHQPIIQSIGDELLVYDPIHAKAHNLSPIAAAVYQACEEGKWDEEAFYTQFGPEVVMNTLLELEKAKLVLWRPPAQLGRREFLAAAAMIPVLSSVSVPSPATAASVTCATTGGLAGCSAAGGVFLTTGSGPSGRGPSGCVQCCGGTGLCSPCPSSCGTCQCMATYGCSDDGVNQVACNATSNTKDICLVGTTDITFAFANCADLNVDNPNRRLSCADARISAGADFNYVCCACP
jgi:hypothetical protein